jgi:hypothetical protein
VHLYEQNQLEILGDLEQVTFLITNNQRLATEESSDLVSITEDIIDEVKQTLSRTDIQ